MKQAVVLFLSVLLLSSCCTKSILEVGRTYIFPKGEKVTNKNFTGNVWLQMLAQDEQMSIGNVTFEPGTRTKWHLHPGGQIILVTEGIGYYQEKGQLKKVLHKGDVIKCPPNVEHWHGASPNSHLVHLAISNNGKGAVVWLKPVTDTEYHKGD
ncbi:cupin domain-containing protein [Chryseobacterium sp. JV274]|uniref:cupin domain-containing protein n=1 Tax=unclassified Chryseobacterium TaxID=2593645 RepID=UPI00098608EF|nr:cupin domain-containing protein [Chryseobacterium sp. JV274]CAD0218702.1 Cupin [Chryseobacterium sp. JV274]